jgi:hypothetical protein
MSSSVPATKVIGAVPVDIPDEREYEDKDNAELDRSLVDAIEAAEAAGNEYLAGVLANELGSHYYATR